MIKADKALNSGVSGRRRHFNTPTRRGRAASVNGDSHTPANSETTTLLSVGYVIWCLRGGSMVATLLTTLPLWRWLDPLPVLDAAGGTVSEEEDDEDEKNIRKLME